MRETLVRIAKTFEGIEYASLSTAEKRVLAISTQAVGLVIKLDEAGEISLDTLVQDVQRSPLTGYFGVPGKSK